MVSDLSCTPGTLPSNVHTDGICPCSSVELARDRIEQPRNTPEYAEERPGQPQSPLSSFRWSSPGQKPASAVPGRPAASGSCATDIGSMTETQKNIWSDPCNDHPYNERFWAFDPHFGRFNSLPRPVAPQCHRAPALMGQALLSLSFLPNAAYVTRRRLRRPGLRPSDPPDTCPWGQNQVFAPKHAETPARIQDT